MNCAVRADIADNLQNNNLQIKPIAVSEATQTTTVVQTTTA